MRSEKMNQIVKKQHYVPQCYLRNFAVRDRLFVLDQIKKSVYSANVKDVAQDRYFNDFPDVFLSQEFREKAKAQVIEKDLAKVESKFSQFLKLIIDCLDDIEKNDLFDSVVVLDEEEKINFSAFLMLQLVRTNTLRQETRHMFQSLVDLKEKMDRSLANCNNPHQFSLPSRDRGIDFNDLIKNSVDEDSIAQHLLLISDALDRGTNSEIAQTLSNHIWLFRVNSTPIPFWTSDNPIVIQPYEDFGTGIASSGVQVIYPISPKHLLIMFESKFWSKLHSVDGMSTTLSEQEVKSYNKLQAQQCYRQTYSRENNFELLLT
jgi:glycerophosphoryl diester phosphodiesterase